ncbi:hypothetical protein AOLI_G00115240 [Acnodon oligacanthus]
MSHISVFLSWLGVSDGLDFGLLSDFTIYSYKNSLGKPSRAHQSRFTRGGRDVSSARAWKYRRGFDGGGLNQSGRSAAPTPPIGAGRRRGLWALCLGALIESSQTLRSSGAGEELLFVPPASPFFLAFFFRREGFCGRSSADGAVLLSAVSAVMLRTEASSPSQPRAL